MSKREEVVPRYISTSPHYYWEDHENAKFEQRTQNFELLIRYMVEQEVVTQGIKMSKGVESILVIRQKTIVLLRTKPTMAQGVHVAIKVKYGEPRLNQQNGNIVRKVSRD